MQTLIHHARQTTLARRRPAQLARLCAPLFLSSCSLAAATIASYPVGTILENIVIAPSGNLFVTAVDSGNIFQVSPSGSSILFGQVPGSAAGVALNSDATLVVASGSSLYRLASDGTPSLLTDIAGAISLNGIARYNTNTFFTADDTANTIWSVNTTTGTSGAWLTGPLLVPPADGLPIGPNGIKLFQGALYVSVTGAGTILRIPILPDGSADTPEVYISGLQADDFAFGSNGSIFAATQLGEIIRVDPDGTRTSLLTGTFGDAAVAFGRTAADLHDIYVVNNGGAFLDLPGGPEAASIVRLTTDTTGVQDPQVAPEPSTLLLGCAGGILALCRLRKRRAT